MKKKIIVGMLLLIISAAFIYYTNTPSINGYSVTSIYIFNSNIEAIAEWKVPDDKDKIKTILRAFEKQLSFVDRNYNEPNYWVHIYTDRGGSYYYTVWIDSDSQASFLRASLFEYKSNGLKGFPSAYPIDVQLRDDILNLLNELNS